MKLFAREPTLLLGLLKALLLAGVAWGLPLSDGQTNALLGVAAAMLALSAANRQVVTPVKKVGDLAGEIGGNANKLFGRLTGREDGAAGWIALLVLGAIVVVIALVFTVCDFAFNDEDEPNDQHLLGRVELVSHHRDRCDDYDECGDYGAGGDGGSSGGHQGYGGGGGRGGSDYDGDGDGPRCRNFCFYGIPAPGGDEQPQSLFPPTPDAIRQFVLSTIQAGIELGRLFADTTITFVSNLLVGIA